MKLIRVEVLFVSNRKTKCFFKELAQSALKNPDLNFKCVFFFFNLCFLHFSCTRNLQNCPKNSCFRIKSCKKKHLDAQKTIFQIYTKKS